ncbi:MAG TPA: peptide chain release factor N(5)-glutamine methyltransferase [Gemmatimonas sp.]|nr:peptide chain release factor N(5)-glutamine methyltransferase [Gemmatimonas sp.]
MRALLEEIAVLLASAPRLDAESRADSRREARLIACGVMDCAPGELARRMDRAVPHTVLDRVRAAANRRASGEPLAYCVGTAPFRHLVLQVDARVLIPRPETEIVVDEVLRVCSERSGGVAIDIGTGSGAIALALATEGRFDRVIATDVSADALEVAAANCERLGGRGAPVELRAGTDLCPVIGVHARVIVSNPPYISFDEAVGLPSSVRDWEPATALFAGDGGMARYEALLAGAPRCLEPGGWLVLEVDARRAGETADRAARAGFVNVRVVQDLSGRDRVLVARVGAGQRER